MLEAATILAHLGPEPGKSLPTDRSIWPVIMSPPAGQPMQLRRVSITGTQPLNGGIQPITPSSLENHMPRQHAPRKTSPDSESTSSLSGTDSYAPGVSPNPSHLPTHGLGLGLGLHPLPTPSLSSSGPSASTPQSVGSLPDMARLNFATSPQNGPSPLPHRGMAPLSLTARAGMIGGGMFNAQLGMRNSSMRSGAADEDEEDDEDDGRREKSSSEEMEERRKPTQADEYVAGHMEL
jgi:hypothetical protein